MMVILSQICRSLLNKKFLSLLACGLYCLYALAAEEVGSDPIKALDSGFQERLLLVDINRQGLIQTVTVLEDKAGKFYLSMIDLKRWRLRLPEGSAQLEFQGESYFPLSAISGATLEFNPTKLTLMIELPPGSFDYTRRDTFRSGLAKPTRMGQGGFFNYDLFAENAPDSTQRSGLFELGYFNRFGVGTTNVLAQDLGSNNPQATRLESVWTIDDPEKLRSLSLGDAINRPGSWGRSLRYGGIQYGTNFETQPGISRFPSQSALGQAILPSTVDVFVNNAQVSRQSIPPGPFSISNLPIVTGAGEVRLVVRDIFGREQLVTQSFYASQTLLREGLEDFSFELGQVRENFGINSNDYRDWLGMGTYRRGLSSNFTGEVHAESLPNRTTVGAGGDYLIPKTGTMNSYLAVSQQDAGMGAMALWGIDRQARPWSIGFRTQWFTREFTQAGLLPTNLPPIQLSSLTTSYSIGGGGSIGMAYVYQQNREQEETRVATLSYSISLGRFGAFSLTAIRNMSGDLGTTVLAILSVPLDPVTSISFNPVWTQSDTSGDRVDFTTTLQHNLPQGEGYGYRLAARSDGTREGTITGQNNYGTYSGGVSQSLGQTTTRLEASGGIAVLGGDAFLSRRIDQSFAVARIPDYPNVRILADNQFAGRTDANGNALIPRLRAYDRNVISIDQRDLPLDATIGVQRLETTPYFRSGTEVLFPIQHSRGATLTLQFEDGKPFPSGAKVQLAGSDAFYVVGFDGEVYLTGLGPVNLLRAKWGGQLCEIKISFPATKDPLPYLGIFICTGVKS
jgi:outer membrane usher protein